MDGNGCAVRLTLSGPCPTFRRRQASLFFYRIERALRRHIGSVNRLQIKWPPLNSGKRNATRRPRLRSSRTIGSGRFQALCAPPPKKNIRAHLVEVRSLFAITSPSVHSVQRPENINNLYPVVTSRRESKRANAHRDWSHLALRKPATSRPVDGRYGGHRFSSAMHGRRIIIQTLHPPRCLRHRPPMQFKEGSLSPRRCGPTSHESLCQRWPPYLPSTGRLVAGFLRAKCHHLVGCQHA